MYGWNGCAVWRVVREGGSDSQTGRQAGRQAAVRACRFTAFFLLVCTNSDEPEENGEVSDSPAWESPHNSTDTQTHTQHGYRSNHRFHEETDHRRHLYGYVANAAAGLSQQATDKPETGIDPADSGAPHLCPERRNTAGGKGQRSRGRENGATQDDTGQAAHRFPTAAAFAWAGSHRTRILTSFDTPVFSYFYRFRHRCRHGRFLVEATQADDCHQRKLLRHLG